MYEKIKLFKKGVADLIFIGTPCEYSLRRMCTNRTVTARP